MNKIVKSLLLGLLLPDIVWADRFTQNGSVVYDSKTQLSWQSTPSTKTFNWSDAKSYCNNLTYGGKEDWRLPNIDELKSLVDYSKYKPAIATTLIDIKTDDYYWSSSKAVSSSSIAWVVDFSGGNDLWDLHSGTFYALCVR